VSEVPLAREGNFEQKGSKEAATIDFFRPKKRRMAKFRGRGGGEKKKTFSFLNLRKKKKKRGRGWGTPGATVDSEGGDAHTR